MQFIKIIGSFLKIQFFCILVLAEFQIYFEELNNDNLTQADIIGWKFYDASFVSFDIFAPGELSLKLDQNENKGINQCGNQIGNKIVGGYHYFEAKESALVVEKIYPILLPHWKIKFKVKVFKIDSWNLDDSYPTYDKLSVYLEKQLVKKYAWNCCDGLIDLCGASLKDTHNYNQALNDAIEIVDADIIHTKNSLTVHFYDTHDSDINETWGFREIQIYIEQCHLSCMSCTGPLETQCTNCYPGSILTSDKKCICTDKTMVQDLERVQNCLSTPNNNISSCQLCAKTCFLKTQYIDTNNGLCQDCSESCEKCADNRNNCISCNDTTFLQGNECIDCIIGCKTCSNGQTCTICLDGYYLLNNICVKCDSQCNTCSDKQTCIICSDGHIKDGNDCIKCPPNCKSCTKQSNSTYVCTSCVTNYFLKSQLCVTSLDCGSGFFGDSQKGACVQKCQDGYFPFKRSQKCEKCHPNCSKCFGKEKNNCYECNSLNFFYNFSCESRCPVGTQENRIVWQCNPTTTNSESANYQAQFKTECYIACQMGKWYNESQWTCVDCDSSCLACEIRSPTNCTMCKENQYLDSSTKKCVNICTDDYQDSDHRQCQPKCLQGYYTKEKYCYKCEFIGCLNCTETQCLECNSQRYFSGNECVCNDGFYSDGIRDECFKCPVGCLKCTSQDTCTECDTVNQFQLQNGLCECPQSMFVNLSNSKCEKCNYSCLNCSNATSCDECDPDSNRQLNQQQCQCQQSFFEIVSDKQIKCNACQEVCKICTNLQTCSLCNSKYPNRILSNSQCICKEFFYEDNPTDYNCTPFPEGCITMNQKDCSKCDKSKGYALIDKKYCSKDCPIGYFYHPELVECVINCGDGYFQNLEKKQCEKCIPFCQSCTDNKICHSCVGGVFLLPDTKQCQKECPNVGYVLQYQQCFKCPTNCKICKSFTSCEECYLPYVKSNSQICFCMQGNYFDEDTQTCKACPNNCSECLNANQCKVCSDQNRELITESNGNITCQCKKSGYFEDNKTKQCVKCMSNCDECQDNQKCTKCNELSYLTEQNICECNSEYFKEDGQCKICILPNCQTCSSSSVCSQCKQNYTKNSKQQCELIKIDPKPDDGNQNGGKDKPDPINKDNIKKSICHLTCECCSGIQQNQCSCCTSTRYLSDNNQCVCKKDYLEQYPIQSDCILSSEVDSTLIKISSTLNLSTISSLFALSFFTYNTNIPITTLILSQSIPNLQSALDYSTSRYYEYSLIQSFQTFNIFPALPKINFISNPNSQINQDKGQTFDQIIIPLSIFFMIILITSITYILKNKYQFCNKIYKIFQYHILLLVYLFSSNHIAVLSAKQIFTKNNDYLPDFLISVISLALLALFMIYFTYFNYKLNQESEEDSYDNDVSSQNSFLRFVNKNQLLSRIIWLLIDIRRYTIISIIFLTQNLKTVLIVTLTFSIIFIIISFKIHPFIDQIQYNQSPSSLNNSTFDRTNQSDTFKMNLFNPQLGYIEEEKSKPQRILQNIINQSRQLSLIEIFFFIYYTLLFINQIYNELIILQSAVIIMLIMTSFVLIINILKIIQQIIMLKNGHNKSSNNNNNNNNNRQNSNKKQNNQTSQKQLEEFIQQLQEQIPNNNNNNNQNNNNNNNQQFQPYNIQVKKNFLFTSNQISKQTTFVQPNHDKTQGDNLKNPQPTSQLQQKLPSSPNQQIKKNQLHLKKMVSMNKQMEKR